MAEWAGVTLSAPATSSRGTLNVREGLTRMGLNADGHRRSDHTLLQAIKSGALHAWKAPRDRRTVAFEGPSASIALWEASRKSNRYFA